ncbi:MAG: outer membrane beta-barrel protein [Bacteroidota bacterium]
MKHLLLLLTIMGMMLMLGAPSALGQDRIGLEIRTGVDFATQKLGDTDLDTGFGFDGIVSYRVVPYTSIFGGWGWHRFTSDDSFAGENMDFEETGYTFGLEYMRPLGNSSLDFYVRGGGIYNHIEVESSDGDITADSDHGLGWQAEAGVAFDLGNQWILKPGVRYRSLSRDIEVGNITTDVDLTVINISIGISKTF